jgi:hypothetical protein
MGANQSLVIWAKPVPHCGRLFTNYAGEDGRLKKIFVDKTKINI